MNEAIRILRDEHRSISSVLHGLRELARTAQDPAVRPDFSVLRAMIYYIDTYPERLHHPKENDVLLIANAGAYGYAMSSHYNLREPATEVLI